MVVNVEYSKSELHYCTYQNAAIARLFRNMEELGSPTAWNRIGIFAKWTHELLPDGLSVMINNYVHSKVGIVDDNWAIVGSANLDGVSLLKKEFVRTDARNNPKDYSEVEEAGKERSSEICVSVPDSSFATALRTALFEHHLGADVPEDSSSWLAVWHNAALDKLTQLKTKPNGPTACTVLPWPRDAKGRPLKIANNTYGLRAFPAAAAFLDALKVDATLVGLRHEVPRYDWKNGNWL
jgi:phosphatidylserine/phosphatidylglycerophosphate/cardiolipin synthase-like enzyme